VGDPGHDDLPISIIHRVDDPIVADSDPKVVTSRELGRPCRSRLRTQRIDGRPYTVPETAMQPAVGAAGFGM
jgi:hypothetical protein